MHEPEPLKRGAPPERVVYLVEQPMATAEPPAGTLDAQTVLRAVAASRWQVAFITLLVTAAGLTYALRASPWFESNVVMALAAKKNMGSLDQLGGIAAITGLDMGANESAEPIAVLKSAELTRAFIEENNLLATILRDRWAPFADFGADSDPSKKPDIRDAVTYFQEKVRFVNEDKKTKLISLTVRWHDPVAAAEWANQLVNRANDRMRERAIRQSQQTVAYLNQELQKAEQISLQQSIAHGLESELSKLAMARSTEDYAFKVIDHATPARRRQWPKRSLIVAASLLAGFLLGTAYAVIRWRPSKSADQPVRG